MVITERMLKCGKTLKTPSLFLNPRTSGDGRLIRDAIIRHPFNQTDKTKALKEGINQIDGIVLSSGDYAKIAPSLLSPQSFINPPVYPLNERIRMIDPALYFLFSGSDPEKLSICGILQEWIPQIYQKVTAISAIKSGTEKTDRNVSDIYPLLNVPLIQRLLEFEIRANADILVTPSVPLSSPRLINQQTEKMREMNKQGRILLDTVLPRYKDTRDLMNLTTLSPSVLSSASDVDNILDATLQGNPDIIGLRIMNLDVKGAVVETKNLLRFIKTISTSGKPVIVFNVREFGYVTFCYGASAISMPIAKSPYMSRTKDKPPREGSFYHCIDMIDYSFKSLPDLIRQQNYKLPCHCEICNQYKSFVDIEKGSHWNAYRKIHFMLVKNMEIDELRKTEVPLNTALADKFSRSQQMGLVQYLP